MKVLFKTVTTCFPDLPHFDMSAANNKQHHSIGASQDGGGGGGIDPGGYDGSINGRCTPSPEAVATGTDRNATLEFVWRIFLGNALKVMKSNAIEDATISEAPKEPPTYLKEIYKVVFLSSHQ